MDQKPALARPRRVMIVDDSMTIRALLEQLIGGRPDLEVVAIVGDPAEVPTAIERFRPDVLTLDLAMPGIDGLTLLGQLMRTRPLPVIVLSSATVARSETAQLAIDLGAAACFDKAKLLTDSRALLKKLLTAQLKPVRVKQAAA